MSPPVFLIITFIPDSNWIIFTGYCAYDPTPQALAGFKTVSRFITTLRGHVQSVYMLAWSADSRLLVSASADSTLKVCTMKTKKLLNDLPGHQDHLFAVDWSADREKVASGGKDKLLKLQILKMSPVINLRQHFL